MKRLVQPGPAWLIAAWLVGLIVLFKPWVHGTDPVGYYSWLRSAVIDGNVDTTDEYYHYGEDQYHIIFPGPNGYNKNPYAIGSAVLWSPFYLTAHFASAILGLPTDGYAPLYVIAASLGSAIYALIGLWLAYRIASEFFGKRVALWATIGIWWSTPLLFYMYSHPIMSHANDAFVNALFVYVWHRTRPAPRARDWLLRGATLGLATLVRAQNALLAVLLVAEVILSLKQASIIRPAEQRDSFANTLGTVIKSAALFGIAAAMVFSLQLWVWRQTYGTWLPGNPYSVYPDNTFDFTSPHFFDLLLSSARGLFIWSPIVALAIAGLTAPLWRRDRTLCLGLILAWLAQVYLVGSWSQWSGGAAFGQRFMINGTVIYIIGLAGLLAYLQSKVTWEGIGTAIAALIAWNLLLLAQYIVELIPRAGPVDLGQMVINQFRVIGIVAAQLGHLIAARLGQWR